MRANVLVVENDAASAETIQSILEREGSTVFASLSGFGVTDSIIENEIDVVLLSSDLPDSQGLRIINSMQNSERTKDIPVITLSGASSVSGIKAALDSGAYDYVKTPPDPAELIARVHAAMMFKTKIDMLKDSAEKDALTKLYNKWYFNKIIAEHILKIRGYKNGVALVMLDCDHFKRINDNYGHMAGDVVLATVANAMEKSVKATDVVCRFGGEEFAIIYPDTSKSQAFEVTERVRVNVSKIDFKFKNENVKMTISCGIGHMDRDNIKTASKLITESDTALYQAKNNGRNRTETAWEN